MSAQPKDRAAFARERTLYVFARALEEADFDTITTIYAQAESDPVLARMLAEHEEAEAARLPEVALAADAVLVKELLAQHLPSAQLSDAEPEPITVAQVAGKLLAERTVAPSDQEALARLQAQQEPVPAHLGLAEVRRMVQRLGVRASEPLLRLFREAALLLGLSQSQQVGFAAARRQGQPRPEPDATPNQNESPASDAPTPETPPKEGGQG